MKNIVVSEYKVDKDVSENCKDLIGKLLGPDTINRIDVSSIFNHAWVKSFETPEKASESEKSSDFSIATESNICLIGDNKEINVQKEQIQSNIDLDISKGTNKNLFDKVINKIEKKHIKKRNQSQETLTQSIAELNDTIEKVGLEAKNKNKITLKVDRVKTLVEDRLSSIVPKNEINYSMLKDIREIDRQIDLNSDKMAKLSKDSNKFLETVETKNKVKSSQSLFNANNAEEFFKTNYSNENNTLILNSPTVDTTNPSSNNLIMKKQLTFSINTASSIAIVPKESKNEKSSEIKKINKTSNVLSKPYERIIKDEDYLGDRIRRRDVTKMMKMRYNNELSVMEDNIFRSNLSAVVEETKEPEKKSAWGNLFGMFKCVS